MRNGTDASGAPIGAADDDTAGVLGHLRGAAHPGAVVDLHDGIGRSSFDGLPSGTLTVRRETELTVLPEVLAAWRDAGYTFTTLSQLIPGS